METTPPCVSLLSRAAGLALLATTALLPAAAPAQEASDILGAVLRGLTQTPESDRELVERAARACAHQAADRDLEVRRVVDARRTGQNNLEVVLRVDDRRSAYPVLCAYDIGDDRVRGLERADRSRAWWRDTDDENERGRRDDDRHDRVAERDAERARTACEDLAHDRDLGRVDIVDIRPRGRDLVEVELRGRDRGDRRNITCLYDSDRRQAYFGD